MKNLNYSILLQDQSEEDQINYALRKCQSHVKTHQSLDQLWESLFSETPTAVIIDIRLINNNKFFFKNHPLIQSKAVALILFYRDSDGPILKNLKPSLVFDQIKFSSNYDLLVEQINYRLNHLVRLEEEVTEYRHQFEAKSSELTAVRNQLYKQKSDELFKTVAYLFTKRFFHQFRMMKNFLPALSKTIEDFSFIESFIVFEVDSKRQHIKTLNLSGKSKIIPSFKSEDSLTNAYFKGYVTKTCNSIIADLFGMNNLSIKLEDNPGRVKYVLGIKVQKDYHSHIDGEFLTRVLSGELQRFYAPEFISNNQKSIHELIPVAERIRCNFDTRNVVYQINFETLKNAISSYDVFHWDNFYRDLITGINQSLNSSGTIYLDGINGLYLLVDYSYDVKDLMYFLDQFMTWSYFDSEESTIGKLVDLRLVRLNFKKTRLEEILIQSYNQPQLTVEDDILKENFNEF